MSETLDIRDREVVTVLKEEIVSRILNNKIQYIEKKKDVYDVYARNLHFICCYTDDEIERMADQCLDLLEELRRINEGGYTRADMEKSGQRVLKAEVDYFQTIEVYDEFRTRRIDEIIYRLGEITRVGGAYYMFISRPTFIRAVYGVFEAIIDKFNDAELYFTALYMLIRLAMHMHCDEIDDGTD